VTEHGGDPGDYQGGHRGASAHTPPSAGGHLEPYGIRVTLRLPAEEAPGAATGPSAGESAGQSVAQPTVWAAGETELQECLVVFLEDVAQACVASGASVIGHLKCLLHLPGHVVACNLTSLREGARCTSRPAALEPGREARLDLAVLVYGLPATTIDMVVRAALSHTFGPLGVSWSAPVDEDKTADQPPKHIGAA
jgi:hypothetical protein